MYHLRLIQGFFIVLCISSGYFIFSNNPPFSPVAGIVAGLLVGLAAVIFEYFFKQYSLGQSIGGITGLVAGLLIGNLIMSVFENEFTSNYSAILSFPFNFISGYLGLVLGTRAGEWIDLTSVQKFFGSEVSGYKKILDTSAIIDGRIADVCETGFLEGTFIVPQFVLKELQHIADSPDMMKKARGRRGMDVLHRMQKMADVDVNIVDNDFPKIREVDLKIVALARVMNAKIITNDINLSKIAELQGIEVLNINELCNALKPVALPGELMNVFVLKEGKEYNQGVAYLDDGTMIVVEDAKRCIGRNVGVSVTSVLQTTAGRMIFARVKDESASQSVASASYSPFGKGGPGDVKGAI